MTKDIFKMVIIFLFTSITMNSSQADQTTENVEGLTIQLDESLYQQDKQIHIKGVFGIFVNCGSQYAIWGQFPQVIRYKLKDLDSGIVYQSINRELSISWNGNSVYEEYAQKPCNKIVTEYFSESLQEIYFENKPQTSIKNYMLQAEYMNFVSEWVSIENKPIQLKSF
jgi:hypothetical protein